LFYTFGNSGERLVHRVEVRPPLNLETKVFVFWFVTLIRLGHLVCLGHGIVSLVQVGSI
jgi:hypothetical protein